MEKLPNHLIGNGPFDMDFSDSKGLLEFGEKKSQEEL